MGRLGNINQSTKQLSITVLGVCIAIAFVPALVYLGVQYFSTQQLLNNNANTAAQLINHQIEAQPKHWESQQALLSDKLRFINHHYFQLVLPNNVTIINSGSVAPRSPKLNIVAPIKIKNKTVAYFKLSMSARPLILRSSLVAAVSSFIALTLYNLFLNHPLRLIRITQHHGQQLQQQLRDAQQRNKQLQQQISYNQTALRHIAEHDLLTDLPNRSLFSRLSQDIINNNQHNFLACLVLDLKGFKEINDNLGRDLGDDIIREISARLQRATKHPNRIAKLASDEFAFLLADVQQQSDIEQQLRHIRQCIELPINPRDFNLELRADIGVSLYPEHGSDAKLLLQRAELALHWGRKNKLATTYYCPELDPRSVQQIGLNKALHEALDHQQIQSFFQPKTNVSENKLSGFEALLRWHHPVKGILGPSAFLKAAEQHRLMPLLFENALIQIGEFFQHKLIARSSTISINLSAQLLQHDHFDQHLKHLIRKTQINEQNLCFEIDEEILLLDKQQIETMINRISDMGIQIAIDNYGAGYSSLSLLKRLPLSEIKISPLLITNILNDDDHRSVVQAAIDIAHDLGLKATAVGIETAAAKELLADMNCDDIQGFYVHRAMSLQQSMQWLKQRYAKQNSLILVESELEV
ncbi:MAG: bifunctional diguanylate cyclase/phosphodiesterase [Gammaproteobacteria bacterium]|nr:bifunctional diguanylate cyclase/phosphodiesterase [Gammaproteobacteria bacterium]